MRQHHPILKIWRVLYPPLLHYSLLIILNFAGMFLFMFLAYSQGGDVLDDTIDMLYKNAVLLTALAALIAIPFLLLFLSRDKKRGQVRVPGPAEHTGLREWLLILIATGTAGLALNNLISLSGIASYSETFETTNEALFSASFGIQIVGIGILVPIAEELVFRGLVYNRLKGYTNYRTALILTSVGFGVYHGNIVQGVYAFCLSALFIVLYEMTGQLMVTIAGHMTVNMTSVFISEFSFADWMYQNYFNFFLGTGVLICVSLASYYGLKKIKDRQFGERLYN